MIYADNLPPLHLDGSLYGQMYELEKLNGAYSKCQPLIAQMFELIVLEKCRMITNVFDCVCCKAKASLHLEVYDNGGTRALCTTGHCIAWQDMGNPFIPGMEQITNNTHHARFNFDVEPIDFHENQQAIRGISQEVADKIFNPKADFYLGEADNIELQTNDGQRLTIAKSRMYTEQPEKTKNENLYLALLRLAATQFADSLKRLRLAGRKGTGRANR